MMKERDNIHSQIQDLALQSQNMHTELLSLSKNLNKLYRERRALFKKSKELNASLDGLSAKIGEKSEMVSSLKSDVNKYNEELRRNHKRRHETIMEHNEEILSKKIMKGGKITNSDLLVFQQGDD